MARITVEDCLNRVPSRFALVMLVAKRAKQLAKGSQQTVSSRENKQIVTALREVAAGFVNFSQNGTEESIIAQIEKDLSRGVGTGSGAFSTDIAD